MEALRRLLQEVVDEERDVLAALAEWRDHELDDPQAVVEILTEAAGTHGRFQVLIRGGDQPDVDADRRVAAHALELPLLDGAEELRLGLERHVTHLVEEEGTAVRCLELPLPPRDRAGEGAALMSEELALHQLPAERGAVHLDHRPRLPGAAVVKRIGDQLLPRSALATDEHGHVRVGDLFNHLEHPSHRGALADDLLEAEDLVHLLEQAAVIAAQEPRFHDAPDDDAELVVVERLGKVVRRAELHRLDRDLLRAVGGDHDDRQVGIDRPGVLENLHAVRAVHAEIGDHEVEASGLDPSESFLAAGGRLDLVALLAEQPLQGEQHRLLVVDDQHTALHASVPPTAAAVG